ncbi:RNA-guided endonuclease InsQ/TnpB family protein [Scytonema sp. PCC 10023]|uniref:RNA-guided endonuclease InsQ/TnpB family protein n=1 Tax=Scytonema sp. PCC 10023 TaxID=1680591 RepID=UPI0039C6C30B
MFAIKRRLKLNKQEQSLMAQHAGFSRLVYNDGLDLFWQSVDASLKASDSKRIQAIKKCLTNITKKRAEFAWMNTMSSKVYQSALQDLQAAFSRWRKGIAFAPTRKTKHNKQSFTVYDSNGSVLVKSGKFIKIPTLGTFRLTEPLKESYISQTFTISREADAWYVSFAVNAERIPPVMHEVVQAVGIDLGVKTFATISDGTEVEAPKPYKIAKTKLGRLQCRNRNKRRGDRRTGEKASNNAIKYYKKMARFHKQIADKRKDFLNKTTTSICKKYAHIKIEDLNVSGMIANRKLSTAISDLGFYEFRRQMEYKSSVFGSKLDIVDQWYPSSKQCRKCGHKHNGLKLKDRVFNCPQCGHIEDRDLHAAINLANAPDNKCSRVGSPRT